MNSGNWVRSGKGRCSAYPAKKRRLQVGKVGFVNRLVKCGRNVEQAVAKATVVKVDEVDTGAIDQHVFIDQISMDQTEVLRGPVSSIARARSRTPVNRAVSSYRQNRPQNGASPTNPSRSHRGRVKPGGGVHRSVRA